MNKIIHLFRLIIQAKTCLLPNSKICLGLSGGQDSINLFLIISVFQKQWFLDLNSIYCNHLWQEETIYLQTHLLLFQYALQKPIFIAINFLKIETENKARNWRYSCYQRSAILMKTSNLMLGHTKTDQLETFIFNLIRGSGSIGFSTLKWQRYHWSFQPICFAGQRISINQSFSSPSLISEKFLPIYLVKNSLILFRPFLILTRFEVSELSKWLQIPIWSDKTNLLMIYSRNLIRHQIFPVFRWYLNQASDLKIANFIETVGLEIHFLETIILECAEKVLFLNLSQLILVYDLEFFQSLPYAIQKRLLVYLLRQLEIPNIHFSKIIHLMKILLLPRNAFSNFSQIHSFLISKSLLLIILDQKFILKRLD
jgi:tRNA(Ile)-lysidine synthase